LAFPAGPLYEDFPRDFLVGFFFFGHLGDLVEWGLKLGLEQKEPPPIRFQGLANSRIVAEEMCGGRGTKLQGRLHRLGEGQLPHQVPQIVHTLVEGGGSDVGAHIGYLPKAFADVDEVLLCLLEDLEEGVHVLGGITGDVIVEVGHEG
jgi:hypothetical protein